MVENFTQTEEKTYTNDVENKIEDKFEAKIKEEIKNLGIEPNQSTIDNILQYSKSFSKK
ncbi:MULTISPECIES: hypothetical protein [Sphingobacterium]|jgi:hypothetical protein|uniref:hypothetical protein n=1 Tax=Sphingobacterium TaxID=28453 RepID=UPI00166B79C5|nr:MULTISPECIES: hypothetical protein [Sphingobacterium]